MVAQVGDHQQPSRPRRQPGAHVGVELDQGVDVHELDARPLEDLLARDLLEDALHFPLGPSIPVGDRVLQEAAVRIEEPVVHAPAVDAHRLDRSPGCEGHLLGFAQAALDAVEDPAEVPTQVAGARLRLVLKPVHLVEHQPVVAQAPEDCPTAPRAEIDGQVQRPGGGLAVARHGLSPFTILSRKSPASMIIG